jgi:mannose-6-phosphate isomerase-like protein (cupin superfamily)
MPDTEHFWLLNTVVTIRLSGTHGGDRISILEHRAPYQDSPPLHLHVNEDEVFHVLEGEARFRLGDTERRAGARDILLVPKGAVHTYRVESRSGARFITITVGGDFERFVRAAGQPATRFELPEPAGPPTEAQVTAFTALARSHGIEIVGPPLM